MFVTSTYNLPFVSTRNGHKMRKKKRQQKFKNLYQTDDASLKAGDELSP